MASSSKRPKWGRGSILWLVFMALGFIYSHIPVRAANSTPSQLHHHLSHSSRATQLDARTTTLKSDNRIQSHRIRYSYIAQQLPSRRLEENVDDVDNGDDLGNVEVGDDSIATDDDANSNYDTTDDTYSENDIIAYDYLSDSGSSSSAATESTERKSFFDQLYEDGSVVQVDLPEWLMFIVMLVLLIVMIFGFGCIIYCILYPFIACFTCMHDSCVLEADAFHIIDNLEGVNTLSSRSSDSYSMT